MFTTADLFGRFHSSRGPLRRARQKLADACPHELAELFGPFLPAGLLAQADEGPNSRNRVYSVCVTFYTFLWQCLHPGSSCRSAVRKVMAWFALLGRPKVSADDSPYCQARRRLSRPSLERALQASAQAAEQRTPEHWRFHGREVLLADGTICDAPDTPKNQRAYPQSSRQRPGCGFPLVRLVAMFSLTSGALLQMALGNKHQSELKLFRKIWGLLKAGMIFLADRGFCDFVTLAELALRQVDCVLRLNGSRAHDFRQGKRLGRWDRLVTWTKPQCKPRTATRQLWRALPGQITVRLIRYQVCIRGFRPDHIVLVTTLLDPVAYPAEQIAELYLRRWRVELFLRDIKTTLQMDHLSCQSPAMLYREIMMHLIAYNLIRCLMVEAASIHDLDLQQLSFKGSLDTILHFSLVMVQARSQRQRRHLLNTMLETLARDPLPIRPHRYEPRCQKRRRKAYPFLMRPRTKLKAKVLGKRTSTGK